MRRWVLWALAAFLAAGLASVAAAVAFGRFSERALGPPSTALAVAADATSLDRRIAPLLAAEPGRSALSLVPANLDAFAARVGSVRAAERSLDSFYYIWQDDLTGLYLLRELRDAAERGVRVRLLLDDIGADELDEILVSLDAHPLVEVRLFNPTQARENLLQRGLEMALRFRSVNRRMHNKAWIADGRVGVVGGRNVGDTYFDVDDDAHFNDLDLVVAGPVLAETERLFDAFWNSGFAFPVGSLSGRDPLDPAALDALLHERLDADALRRLEARLRQADPAADLLDPSRVHWTASARLLADPPAKAGGEEGENWLMRDLAPVLDSAQTSLEIMSPYFVPKEEGTAWIVGLARRGVAVDVLTNSLAATDVAAVHGGYAPFREELLRGGVRLFELRASGSNDAFSLRGSTDARLHTKAFTVDGRLAFVGSLNFDPRSVSLNTEMGVLFEVPELVAEIRALFAKETLPIHSYAVTLDGDALRWTGEEDGRPVVHTSEPNAGLARRAIAVVMAWLPLDSQL